MNTVNEQVAEIIDKPAKRCWFNHKWTQWSSPYDKTTGGMIAAIGTMSISYQNRHCLRCNRTQKALV